MATSKFKFDPCATCCQCLTCNGHVVTQDVVLDLGAGGWIDGYCDTVTPPKTPCTACADVAGEVTLPAPMTAICAWTLRVNCGELYADCYKNFGFWFLGHAYTHCTALEGSAWQAKVRVGYVGTGSYSQAVFESDCVPYGTPCPFELFAEAGRVPLAKISDDHSLGGGICSGTLPNVIHAQLA